MTRYQVTARCNFPHYATFEVEAGSFRAALRQAQEQATGESPEPCDGAAFEWAEFEIRENDGSRFVTYLEPSRRLANAAEHLLRAAEFALPILELLACSSENREERKAYYKLRRAIHKATKR